MRLHASAVSFAGRAVLITGASGTGKSALALRLIGLGGTLVADDQTDVALQEGLVRLSAPPAIAGMIEARGIGVLGCPTEPATLAVVVDLDREEPDRLPPFRHINILDRETPLILGAKQEHLAEAVKLYLLHGRQA